ncbi:unnamed protein product [Arabidopsis halleri]
MSLNCQCTVKKECPYILCSRLCDSTDAQLLKDNSDSEVRDACRDMISVLSRISFKGNNTGAASCLQTGPIISHMSNEIANEALNFICTLRPDHNFYGICVSWIQQLVEVLLKGGSEMFEVPMELRYNFLYNFQMACPSPTMDPPDQLVVQLASARDIEVI